MAKTKFEKLKDRLRYHRGFTLTRNHQSSLKWVSGYTVSGTRRGDFRGDFARRFDTLKQIEEAYFPD